MKVVVTGAGGRVGARAVETLARQDEVDQIVGLVWGRPGPAGEKVRWLKAELLTAPLEPIFDDADVVIHLAWAIQPYDDATALEQVNVGGSRRVFEAAAAAGVPKLVYASSVGAYVPGPRHERVDETWPIGGIETSLYSRQKAAVEAQLDAFERQAPGTRIVRMRPATIFGASPRGSGRLLEESLLVNLISRSGLVSAMQLQNGLCFQAIHSSDLARAYALAATRDVGGAFNLAADPLLDSERLSGTIGSRRIALPRRLARLSWRLRLRPNPPDWLELAMKVPLVSTERAARELGWAPRISATEALAELLGQRGESGPAEAEHVSRGEAERRLIGRLAEAYAIERRGISQLRHAVAVAGNEGLAELFQARLAETEVQARQVRERLVDLGADPDDPTVGSGGIAIEAFAASRPQGPGRLVALVFAYQHMEIFAYEQLRQAAEATGDVETTELADEILAQEQAMAERLVEGFDLAIEASLNGGGDSGKSLLDRCLVDAHAIEREGLHLLETAPRIVTDPSLKQLFAEHLRESGEHEAIVRERLEARGVATARGEDAMLRLVGMQIGARLAGQPDTVARLIGFASAYDHLEIATYELLARAARHAGDDKVLAAAERILAEERAVAGRLTGRSTTS